VTGERLGVVGYRAYRGCLRIFGRMPRPLRRFVIRRVTPNWTAGTMALIERDDGRILLVKPVYRSGWALPGGLVDRGEHPEATIRREMTEEIGADIEVTGGPCVIHDSDLHRIDVLFSARLAAGTDPDALVVCTPELESLGWFGPDELPDLHHDQRLESDLGRRILELRKQVADGGSPILLC